MTLYVYNNSVTYFDGFRVEHIPKEIKKFIGNKSTATNVYKIQVYDSIMSFIAFLFKDKTLTDYTNSFSPNNVNNDDKIILNYFLNWN